FGIACLDTGNFSGRDTIVSLSLDARPSLATQQKRLLKKQFDEFTPAPRSAGHLDIAGALLYAVAQLGETNAEERYVLILANLGKEQIPEPVKDFPLQMEGCRVIPITVENEELTARQQPAALKRLEAWEEWVETGGGEWQVVNDLALLATIFPGS
ncbi:MAG TPA: VWA domain-containing protein, partial [Syntrophobacteria bacterium]|nr:VWA domain-containing protein [Syntrophobacteria bacterium]